MENQVRLAKQVLGLIKNKANIWVMIKKGEWLIYCSSIEKLDSLSSCKRVGRPPFYEPKTMVAIFFPSDTNIP
jgi:hypothetical protein